MFTRVFFIVCPMAMLWNIDLWNLGRSCRLYSVVCVRVLAYVRQRLRFMPDDFRRLYQTVGANETCARICAGYRPLCVLRWARGRAKRCTFDDSTRNQYFPFNLTPVACVLVCSNSPLTGVLPATADYCGKYCGVQEMVSTSFQSSRCR